MNQTTTATAALINPALWGGKGSYPASQAEYEAAWEAVHGLPATPANRRALAEHLRRSPAQAATLSVAPGLDHDVAFFRPEGRDVSAPTRRVQICAPWTPEMDRRMGGTSVFRVVLSVVP